MDDRPPAPSDLVGQIVDGLLVESVLHRGFSATIYRARQPEVGDRPVALKVMNALEQRLLLDGKTERSPLWREARYSQAVRDKAIVHVFRMGQVPDGRYYVAMELVDGPSLRQMLEGEGPPPWEEAFRLVAELVWALARLHEGGVTHADLKPENVLLKPGPDGVRHVRIIDFGRAVPDGQRDQTSLELDPSLLGTPRYMAPEQATKRPISHATDVYAVGAIFYELLTGIAALDLEPPTAEACLAWLASEQPIPVHPLKELAPDVPPAFDPILRRCLSRRPEMRYADGTALKVALLEAMVAAERARPRGLARLVRVFKRTRPIE